MSNPIVLHYTPDIIKEWLGKFIERAKAQNEAKPNIAMLEDISTLVEHAIGTLNPTPQNANKPN